MQKKPAVLGFVSAFCWGLIFAVSGCGGYQAREESGSDPSQRSDVPREAAVPRETRSAPIATSPASERVSPAPAAAAPAPVSVRRPVPVENEFVSVREVDRESLGVSELRAALERGGVPFLVLSLKNLRSESVRVGFEGSDSSQPFEVEWEVHNSEPKNDGTNQMVEKEERKRNALSVVGVGFSTSAFHEVPYLNESLKTILVEPFRTVGVQRIDRVAFYARSVGEIPDDGIREFDVRVKYPSSERIERISGTTRVVAGRLIGFPKVSLFVLKKDGTRIPIFQ